MWEFGFILLALFLGLSSSPLVAVMALIVTALVVSSLAGVFFNTWFFFTIVVIYVGGMMVMFVYLSSLMSSFKINLLSISNESVAILLSAFLLVGLQSPNLGGMFFSWVMSGFYLMSFSLIVFLICYLLVGLISVFKMCDKTEGPLMNKTKN